MGLIVVSGDFREHQEAQGHFMGLRSISGSSRGSQGRFMGSTKRSQRSFKPSRGVSGCTMWSQGRLKGSQDRLMGF